MNNTIEVQPSMTLSISSRTSTLYSAIRKAKKLPAKPRPLIQRRGRVELNTNRRIASRRPPRMVFLSSGSCRARY